MVEVARPVKFQPRRRQALADLGFTFRRGMRERRCPDADAQAEKKGITFEEAIKDLLGETQPTLQFTTPAQLGELAVLLCSAAADNVRGVAWAVDGGWTAQ